MEEQEFQINEYRDRVAIVTDIDRTSDPRYREICGYWADNNTPFAPRYIPTEMRVAEGDPIYVVEQTKGIGANGLNEWLAFTSDAAPKKYWASNAPSLPKRKPVDVIGGGVNALIELAAVIVLAVVGWQYSWWAAALMGAAAAALAWWGHIKRYRRAVDIKKAQQDERNLYPTVEVRLDDKKREWKFWQEDDEEVEQPRQQQREEAKPQQDPVGLDWRKVLELSADCTLADAEAAYKRLIRQCHPDVNRSLPPRMRELAEGEARRLNNAIEEARRHFGVN